MKYLGIFLGAGYGIVFRLLNESNFLSSIYGVNSIVFLWLLPIVIAVLPILVAKNEILFKRKFYALLPLLSIIVFFVSAFLTRIEDIVCLMIIGAPHLLIGVIAGLIIGFRLEKKSGNKLYGILMIPLILGPIESLIPKQSNVYQVENSIFINSKSEDVWSNIIEVPELTLEDYELSFFNKIGVPRPVRSKMEFIAGVEYHVGYFTDDFILIESIDSAEYLNFVRFKVHMDKSHLRDLPMDNHILASDYFKFNEISYCLIPKANGTELKLKCEYQIESNMQWYSNFWAELIISDFEIHLLKALKKKIEL